MKDTECYVNKAEVKRKIRVWLDYRTSRQVTDGLLDLIEKLPVTVKGQLETTLESKWISVNEKLPKPFKPVLVYDAFEENITPGLYGNGDWLFSKHVTHWMPLPEPPESEVDAE